MSEITPRSPVDQIVEASARQILPHEARLQCQSMFAWDNEGKPPSLSLGWARAGHEVSGTTIVSNSTVFDDYLFVDMSFELVITHEGLHKNSVHVRDIWGDDDDIFIASMGAPETWEEVVKWCRMVAAMQRRA